MAVIRVPAYSENAFQKNAPISDLVAKQIEHFLHVEAHLPRNQRSGFRLKDLRTENDAAHYIAYMTAALQGRKPAILVPARLRDRGLAIAAGAATPPKPRKSRKSKSAKQPPSEKKDA